MNDYALILNAGSSSLKFCVYCQPKTKQWRLEARGQITGIGTAPRLSVKEPDGGIITDEKLDAKICDGYKALDALIGWLRPMYGGSRVLGIAHRIVHGGLRYDRPTILSRQILEELHQLVPLAPLHQRYNLAAVEEAFRCLPDVPQVACFDTSFHRGHAAVAKLVPLSRDICREELQRYGFHGLSYEYIASELPKVAPEIADGRVIVAHLGSGASLCALRERKSVDCTMGFTSLDGLCMGTRPGTLDPGVVLYLFQHLGLSAREVEDLLYRKSGLLGISSATNDMRALLSSNEPGAALAVDYFVYRAAKEIGALAAVLAGIDALVFTAGIGENSPEIRRRICEASAWLGINLDAEANACGSRRISHSASKVSVWVLPTNEELMMARHMGSLLGLI